VEEDRGTRADEIGAPDGGLAAAIAGDFTARCWERMELSPDVPEALDRLRQRGVSLTLVTNGDRSQQRRKIEQFVLARFFDGILSRASSGRASPTSRCTATCSLL
jgi:FMN phosphatase YigB (HAD superfamily)